MAKHLSAEERIIISQMRSEGKSFAVIGKHLGRSAGTICDEIKRNRTTGCHYCPVIAHAKAKRRARKPRVKRKMRDPFIRGFVIEHLPLKWSPEQISGRLKVLYPSDGKRRVSHESIYKWVWSHKKKKTGEWHKHLRSGLKKKRRGWRRHDGRCAIKGRVGIEQRPESVEQRLYVGDWEGDTVVGGYGKSRIASWVERKYRYVCLVHVDGRGPEALNKAVCERFSRSPELPIRTFTVDNGAEFWRHEELSEALNCTTYFARPHHPWERGLNENTNGLLRQFYPKGTDFREVTPEELAQTERLLNTRPRKCLQYRTPMEAMEKALAT